MLPVGVVGSLAHDAEIAVAAVTGVRDASAIGIDVESIATLEREVADLILRSDDQVHDATLALVLKEAAYKAWSTVGGRLLGHHDMSVAIGDDSTFSATVHPDGVVLPGRYAECETSGWRWW